MHSSTQKIAQNEFYLKYLLGQDPKKMNKEICKQRLLKGILQEMYQIHY